MPTYDYECKEYGKSFIKQERIDQHRRRRTLKCPGCGSLKTRQVMSAVFVQTSKKS